MPKYRYKTGIASEKIIADNILTNIRQPKSKTKVRAEPKLAQIFGTDNYMKFYHFLQQNHAQNCFPDNGQQRRFRY